MIELEDELTELYLIAKKHKNFEAQINLIGKLTELRKTRIAIESRQLMAAAASQRVNDGSPYSVGDKPK